MFIAIPGNDHEGDEARDATSYPTLDDTLTALTEQLGIDDTITVLDANGAAVTVAATAQAASVRPPPSATRSTSTASRPAPPRSSPRQAAPCSSGEQRRATEPAAVRLSP